MYPSAPVYVYVCWLAVEAADIVLIVLPLELATVRVLVELPLLLRTTLIVLFFVTGTFTARPFLSPVPPRAKQYVYAVPSTVAFSALTDIVLELVAISVSPSTDTVLLIVPRFLNELFLKFHDVDAAETLDTINIKLAPVTKTSAKTSDKNLLAFLILIPPKTTY